MKKLNFVSRDIRVIKPIQGMLTVPAVPLPRLKIGRHNFFAHPGFLTNVETGEIEIQSNVWCVSCDVGHMICQSNDFSKAVLKARSNLTGYDESKFDELIKRREKEAKLK